jgi:hypothetical protein
MERMKLLLLVGGLVGFVIGISLGLVHEKSLPSAVVHACVTLYVGGLLMRWWRGVWIKALRESHEEGRRG